MQEHQKIVIIGAGQGGLGVSYYLSKAGLSHLILDRGDIANSWKENRWDSFCLVTPNWTLNFPGKPYAGTDPDGFMKRDDFVRYMSDWAESFNAPVRKYTNVHEVSLTNPGFLIKTDRGDITAEILVVATATHQRPKIPDIAIKIPKNINQLHADQYKNTSELNDGGVLVVGSGQTGCQVVEDLVRDGRDTYLCVGRTGRLPRRYRGRDAISWQKEMNLLDRTPDMLGDLSLRFRPDPHCSGRDGGQTLSLHNFNRAGVKLLGRLEDATQTDLIFGNSIKSDIKYSDDFASDFRKNIDAYIIKTNIDAPLSCANDFEGEQQVGDPSIKAIEKLDFKLAGINTIIWATGFQYDFSWIEAKVTDQMGYPVTDKGHTGIEGLYFNGLNWMTKRKSGILYGFDEDSVEVSNQIISLVNGSSQYDLNSRDKVGENRCM